MALSFRNNRQQRIVAGDLIASIPYLFPALFVMGLVILYPILEGARLSLYDFRLTRPLDVQFAWLSNYGYMIRDHLFWRAMRNTFVFTFLVVAISSSIGLIMALVLNEITGIMRFLRGFLLIPWVIPGIVIGYLFLYMFDVEIGIINYVLVRMGIIGRYLPWLADSSLAMASVVVAHVWNQTPFYILMFTAALMAIPQEAFECAYLEGASRLQEFVFVTSSYLKKIYVISTLLMIIRNFNFFPIIYTMTGGGPAYSTTTAVLYIYQTAFERFDIGYASSIGTVWVIILLCLSIVYTRTLKDSV